MRFSLAMLFVLLLTIGAAGCAPQRTSTAQLAAPDVTLQVEPEALSVGETALRITLLDASGSPIEGASLQVHGDMDHQGMMPVDREVSQSTDGVYQVPFEWTMGGGWIVTVTADLPAGQGQVQQTFEFFVEAASRDSIINQAGQGNSGH